MELSSYNFNPLLSNDEILTQYSFSLCYHCIEHKNFSFWQQIYQSHNPLDWIYCMTSDEKKLYVLDEILIQILLFLKLPQIETRNFQEGITLLVEKNNFLYGFLIFQNNVYGIFEHNLSKLCLELLQKNIEEFRFGWLPNEEIIKQQGYGCILKDIPAEAEGFKPTYIIQDKNMPYKELFKQIGRTITLPTNTIKILNSILLG